jgi:hypothetical protein
MDTEVPSAGRHDVYLQSNVAARLLFLIAISIRESLKVIVIWLDETKYYRAPSEILEVKYVAGNDKDL